MHFKWTFLNTVYVITFGKTCIVSTFDFAHLDIHKYHRKRYIDLQFSGMIKELQYVVQQSLKVSHLYVIQNRFYELPNLKSGRVNYAFFTNLVIYMLQDFILESSYCVETNFLG